MNKTTERLLRTVLYISVVVLLNFSAVSAFIRMDLTENRIHTLSDASKNAVATLQEPLTIQAFFSRNMPAPYNNVEQQVRDLLEEYARWGNEFFNYSFHSMDTGDGANLEVVGESEEIARSYRIYPIQIEQVEKDEVKLITAYMGLAFIHGDLLETIPAITSADRLEFSVTQNIQTLNQRVSTLVNLDEDIQVKLFLSSALFPLGDSIAEIPAELQQAVARLNRNYFNRIGFTHFDPSVDEAGIMEAQRYKIPRIPMAGQSGGAVTAAYAGLIISHGEEAFGGSLIRADGLRFQITEIESMEALIENSVRAILGIHDEIGYLADFGTPPYRGLSQQSELTRPDLQTFYPLISQDYRIKGLLLEDGEIPQSLKSMLIVSPRETFNDWALFQIDQFLLGGGSLLLFLDAFDVYVFRQPGTGEPSGESYYEPRQTGIEELIRHYGVSLSDTFVMDENSYVYRERNQRGGVDEVPIYAAPIIERKSMNSSLGFINNLDRLLTISISPLKLEAREEENTAHLLFSSSENSWEMSYEEISLYGTFAAQPPPGGKRSYPLAYLLEGEFTSYFAGRPIPSRIIRTEGEDLETTFAVPQEVETQEAFLSRGSGKLFVVGTSMILGANMLDAEGNNPNALFLINTIDYMNGRGQRAEMRAKGARFARIEESTAQRRTFVKMFNIAGLPAFVTAIGLLIWLHRIGRKKRLVRRFQGTEAAAEQVTGKSGSSGRRGK